MMDTEAPPNCQVVLSTLPAIQKAVAVVSVQCLPVTYKLFRSEGGNR